MVPLQNVWLTVACDTLPLGSLACLMMFTVVKITRMEKITVQMGSAT